MATDNYSGLYLEEDSDQERAIDSEDDIESWLADVPQPTGSKTKKKCGVGTAYSSEDEFEKEMNSELDSLCKASFPHLQQQLKTKKQLEDEQNDQLLYDPKMDDDDQMWVDKKRASYHPSFISGASSSKTTNSKTDAVLNCPACMCAVCLDCQRHEVYHSQYRAMFTLNTLVNYGETLQFKKKPDKSKPRRKRKHNAQQTVSESNADYTDMEIVDTETMDQSDESGLYHPVHCSNCNTRVAVFDSDEVYHFFNVIASYS